MRRETGRLLAVSLGVVLATFGCANDDGPDRTPPIDAGPCVPIGDATCPDMLPPLHDGGNEAGPTDRGATDRDVTDRDPPDRDPPDQGPPTGTPGGPCRDEAPACDDGLRCLDGRCTRPVDEGGPGEPCRATPPVCDDALACVDAICQIDPRCPDGCVLGETRCHPDNTGYQVCGGTPAGNCTAFGGDRANPITVLCDEDRVCQGGRCVAAMTQTRAVSEIALLIDRGGIPPAQWQAWSDAIVGWIKEVEPSILIGARTFPGPAGPCTSGPGATREPLSSGGVRAIFERPPPLDASRPIFQQITTAPGLLAAPTEGQYVVLITAGGDTCDPPEAALRQIRHLRGRGLKVRVLHIDIEGTGPDPELDALARAGGFDPPDQPGATRVATPEALRVVLTDLGVGLDPACGDLDGDLRGSFCHAGPDCSPLDSDSHEGATEQCDGRDNNCVAGIDEGIADQPATLTAGVCAGQLQRCLEGGWREPDYAAIAHYEAANERRCDRLDNDCDGRADEGLGDRAGACRTGIGECARDGRWLCDPDRPSVSICEATLGAPAPELCDGLDNDCDERIDEDAPVGGTERCNGRDDDCDGTLDEDPVLDDCPGLSVGEAPLGCVATRCVIGCAPDTRDTDGRPGCEAPAFPAFALGDGFTCIIDPETDGPECYGRPDAPRLPLEPALDLAAGGRHACFIHREAPADTAGAITCVGPDPTLAAGSAARFQAIGLGDRIGCGLTVNGTVQCWGPDPASNGEFEARGGITEITVGARHVCARDEEGFVSCHGHCGAGCSGQGVVPAGQLFSTITAGLAHTCGLVRADGSIRCWGAGSEFCNGAICGENRGQSIPPAGTGYRAIAAGALHTCAIGPDFRLRCWGDTADGRLTAPAGQFTEVHAGAHHTCARRVDGRIRCWGRNDGGSTQPLD